MGVYGLLRRTLFEISLSSWKMIREKRMESVSLLLSKPLSRHQSIVCVFDSVMLCVFYRSVPKVTVNEKKAQPISTMSETSNYTGGSDTATSSPAGRVSVKCDDRTIVHVSQIRKTMENQEIIFYRLKSYREMLFELIQIFHIVF